MCNLAFNHPSVLLVEDNRVNREFAIEVLEGLGCVVTSAENGKISLEKMATETFDIVLMDVQMPVMGGLEAMEEIRRMFAAGKASPCPMVALTANAMKGDRDRCLQSGADDYLAKPMTKKQLVSVLARWLPESKRRVVDKEQPGSVVDLTVLGELQEIMHTRFPNFISLYLDDTQANLQNLERLAREESPAEDVIIPVHSIKSTARQVGINAMASLAEQVERQASELARQGGRASGLLSSMLRLSAYYNEAKPILEAFVDRNKASA